MPRRKTITDDQVLDVLFQRMMETGPDGLTFAVSANTCGLSPATLVQRYGNREALVEAVLLRAWDRLQADTEAGDIEEAVTREGAINLLMRLMPVECAEHNMSDGLLLLREDIRNPVLRSRGTAWGYTLAAALGRRLSEDRMEAERLGWQMAAVWQGTHIWWAFTRREQAEVALRRALEEWVARL